MALAPDRPHTRRRSAAMLLFVASALAVGSLTPAASAAGPEGAPAASSGRAEIRPGLEKRLQKGKADFWVRLDEKADLSVASLIDDWDERGAAVVEALQETAESSQKGVIRRLDAAGVDYESFWATNSVYVEDGSQALATSLTTVIGVDSLWPAQTYGGLEPMPETSTPSPQAVEWGVANINADDAWAKGVDGDGIVIANIDSGVQFDHPALVGKYRGNNGDGTFTHDYNWLDTSGSCGAAPCDTNSHGTHTMGTMVGSDGGANQIGVAPGATWITANGCDTCSNADLAEAGQWMLAPTKLDGTGADAAKRPNIVNNSWGTELPSNDPFIEDISAAWAASGIFGVWSNGNNGPSCRTSGSPGSRIVNYSVGAYDVNNAVAPFSSRGEGQDGAVKPDIAAPGVNVRSAVPGSDYRAANGTSMAAPHVAGAIALLWSAQPALVGDIAWTTELLDQTAIDSADDQCGGTPANNNVFGEGRLDALALIEAADFGDIGTLTGQVRDDDGKAVAGASVRVTGGSSEHPVDRTVAASADGDYRLQLPAGAYEITGQAFGYDAETVALDVAADQTVTQDFTLTRTETATVSGTVTDGSGQDWPLYAKITAVGVPDGVVFTEPTTGEYEIELPVGAAYDLRVEPVYPGYETVTESVDVDEALRQDVSVPVDASTCVANGYAYRYGGATERFDGAGLPAGWEIVDHLGTGLVWDIEDGSGEPNRTGGSGAFAAAPTDPIAGDRRQDTSLLTAPVDLGAASTPVLQFQQHFDDLGAEKAEVAISLDGGETWQTVLTQDEVDVPGPDLTAVELPQAAGEKGVRARFRFGPGRYNWWTWQVDDVFIGQRSCDPVAAGGYLVGNVHDANTGDGIDGAAVSLGDTTVKTTATPADSRQDDGFYWLYAESGDARGATATASQYESESEPVTIDGVNRTDFSLAAGHLSITPATLEANVELGDETATRTFTLTNDGTASATVRLGEGGEDFTMQGVDGSGLSTQEIAEAPGARPQQRRTEVSLAARPAADPGVTAEAAPAEAVPAADPWVDLADQPVPVLDNRVVAIDEMVYSVGGSHGPGNTRASMWRYDPARLSWTERQPLPEPRSAMTVGAIDGRIVLSGGWGAGDPEAETWIYDPDTDRWTAAANNPAPRASAGQAVLNGKLYAVGGCTTGACTPTSATVVAYDPVKDAWEQLADYPTEVAYPSCGGVNGMLVCSGGTDGTRGVTATWGYDPKADTWRQLADAPDAAWAAGSAVANGRLIVVGGAVGNTVTNAARAYDPVTDSWSALPNANAALYRGGAACGFYRVGGSTGGFAGTQVAEMLPGHGDCSDGAADVGWMSMDHTEATLAVGESMTVEVTLTGQVAQPGAYTAGITLKENTPYAQPALAVALTATPPRSWGKLAGTVRGTACDGSAAPLAGATVTVDSERTGWTFATRADGTYAYWIDRRDNPLTLYASKDGYRTQGATARIAAGKVSTVDFDLVRPSC